MLSAKEIEVKPIASKVANALVRRLHYSGKVVNNSQLHFGVFLAGRLEGVMSFGPPFDKRTLLSLVSGTGWNGFLELNRMAFSAALPRNSESRALGVALRTIKKAYPHIEWIVSFADATQCGDGTIYRAAGFILTGIKKNNSILRLESGEVVAEMTYTKGKAIFKTRGKSARPPGAVPLEGFMLRYVYFLKPEARQRLTVPIIPFSKIAEIGAGMYRGQKTARVKQANSGDQPGSDGAAPIHTLQKKKR
jgi:hypothetical protein